MLGVLFSFFAALRENLPNIYGRLTNNKNVINMAG